MREPAGFSLGWCVVRQNAERDFLRDGHDCTPHRRHLFYILMTDVRSFAIYTPKDVLSDESAAHTLGRVS
jgi:hypothetical protein